nr:MAG TPA: hypothetical protein [Caudoviricetes sp.]
MTLLLTQPVACDIINNVKVTYFYKSCLFRS